MEKGKVVRLVLIPIIIGLVVTLIVRQLLAPTQTETASQQQEMVSVVAVATKDPVAARVKLTEQHLALKQVPKVVLTGNEFNNIQDVVGQVTEVQLEPGEMILRQRVVPEGKGTLPYRIPNGTRAITIRIDELSGVAGHPETGDLVDLVLFLPPKPPERTTATTRILFESVQVLGKGPALPATEGGSPAGGEGPRLTSLTLALKPEAAAEVALAEQLGHVKVLLRPALKEPEAGQIIINENRYLGTQTVR